MADCCSLIKGKAQFKTEPFLFFGFIFNAYICDMKAHFCINHLTRQLLQEERSLRLWQHIAAYGSDVHAVSQANGNIPSTEHRISELKLVIQHLQSIDLKRERDEADV